MKQPPIGAAHNDRSVLWIVQGATEPRLKSVVPQLAKLLRSDERSLEMRLTAGPGDTPRRLGVVREQDRKPAVDLINGTGAMALVVSNSELALPGPAMLLKDLTIEPGRFAVDLWRGPSTTIPFEHVRAIVRSTLDEGRPPTTMTGTDLIDERTRMVYQGIAFMVTGRLGMLHGLTGLPGGVGDPGIVHYETKLAWEVLDFHTVSGAIFRVDSRKFAYRCLGELRGHTDRVNAVKFAEMVQHFCPQALYDCWFELFPKVPEAKGLRRLVGDRTADELNTNFDYYSRWSMLLLDSLMAE